MDTQKMLTPAEVVEGNIKIEENRVKIPFPRLMVLAFAAGMFIALGAASSSVAMHNISNVGLARVVGGCIFPVGLMLIVFLGGELFTGDCMLAFGVYSKKVKVLSALRVLALVWIGNMVGACAIAGVSYFSGQWNYSDSLLGAYTIKVALGKCNMSFGAAFASGILCNILVCAAVLMASAAKDGAGKVLGVFFPIFAFVTSGYEHCVANMYYIPAGIMAKANDAYVQKAMDTYGYTAEQLKNLDWAHFFLNSSLPVTLGNMVGGMLFVSLVLFLAHKKKEEK